MTSPLVPRRPAPPQRSFQAALVLPGLAAVAALVAGYLSGGISVTERAGFVSSVPHGLVTLLGALAAVLLVVSGLVVTRLRRRFDEDRLHSAALAVTDELTGVGTRRFVMERLEDELGRARRYERRLSCALIDVDGLARVNDAVGVDAGDAVLRSAAGAVRAQLRRSDSVGRLRDDELLVVLPETDEAGARVISERLRQAVASLQVLHAGLTLQATVSLGITTYAPAQEREPPGPEALLRRADEALFRAKAAGRNRVA
jgi:diguanylate cyclase (GGDEF)-like protein